jgi:hypothetical protein
MLILEITIDNYPINPRSDYNLGTMVCWHPRYKLGDDHSFKTPEDFREFCKECRSGDGDGFLMLPLYLYDHSGITISTSPFHDPWDSGQVGWIYAEHSEILREFGANKITPELLKRARRALESEVEIYDHYIRGLVYAFRTIKVNMDESIEINDCVSGFYGPRVDENGLLEYVPQQFVPVLQEHTYVGDYLSLVSYNNEVYKFESPGSLADYLRIHPYTHKMFMAYDKVKQFLTV